MNRNIIIIILIRISVSFSWKSIENVRRIRYQSNRCYHNDINTVVIRYD